jgi:tRNA threonylcarbamoyladenosine biosynthesis protein TsaE
MTSSPALLPLANLEGLPAMVKELAQMLTPFRVVAFYGEMGAGKTTLIKALIVELGSREGGSSPTFSLVNEYALPKGERIFHFDFYRINRLEEAFDIGYEEYFYGPDRCFIEWPEKIETLLPEETLRIYISVNPDESRTIRIG